MSVNQKLLTFLKDLSDNTRSPFEIAFDRGFIKRMSHSNDAEMVRLIKEFDDLLCLVQIQDHEKIRGLLNIYAEMKFYSILKGKFQIEGVPRVKGKKTPDFKITTNGGVVYGEVKCFSSLGGNYKQDQEMIDGTTRKINLQEKAEKEGSAIDINAYSPFEVKGKPYDRSSVKMVTESIISKYAQNFKRGQYELGPTISLIYLRSPIFTLIAHPLHLSSTRSYKVLECSSDNEITGELFTACFGTLDQDIKSLSQDTLSIYSEKLEKQGILVDPHPNLKGILFYHDGFSYESLMYLANSTERGSKAWHIGSTITSIYNDEKNTESDRLKKYSG